MTVSIKVRAAAETTNLSLKCFIGCRDSHLSSCVRCVVWLPCIGLQVLERYQEGLNDSFKSNFCSRRACLISHCRPFFNLFVCSEVGSRIFPSSLFHHISICNAALRDRTDQQSSQKSVPQMQNNSPAHWLNLINERVVKICNHVTISQDHNFSLLQDILFSHGNSVMFQCSVGRQMQTQNVIEWKSHEK